jgi:hypothetical protein
MDGPWVIYFQNCNWLTGFREEDFKIYFPKGPMLKLCSLMVAILDGGRGSQDIKNKYVNLFA